MKETAVASLLPMVLRALCVVMSASPYDRLPPQLLPDTAAALLARWSVLATTAPVPLLTDNEPGQLSGPTLCTAAGAPMPAASMEHSSSGEEDSGAHRYGGRQQAIAYGGVGRGLEEVGGGKGGGAVGGVGVGGDGGGREGPASVPLRLPTASGVVAIHTGESLALQVAYLACLAEAFSTRQPQQGMRAYLQSLQQPACEAEQAGGALPLAARAPPAFVWQLLHAGVCCHPALRIEALAALKGLATHYAFTLPGACVLCVVVVYMCVCVYMCQCACESSPWLVRVSCVWLHCVCSCGCVCLCACACMCVCVLARVCICARVCLQ